MENIIKNSSSESSHSLSDIQHLKKINEGLQQSLENLNAVLKNVPVIVFAVDRDYKILYINHVPAGLSVEESIGTDAVSYVTEEYRELVKEKIKYVFNTGNRTDYRISARGPFNSIAWYSTELVPVKVHDSIESVILITSDITEFVNSENHLKNSESRWRSLVSEAPDIILTLDRNYKILYINHTAPGITPEESIGKNVLDFVPPDYHEIVKEKIKGVFHTGEQAIYETKVEVIQGNTLWYSTRISAIKKDQEIDSVILITRDITDQKKLYEDKHLLEIQLERSQRMESIGRITGGIAHDFNNILSVILLNSELSAENPVIQDSPVLAESMNQIIHSCIRAKDIIGQMLTFSKPEKISKKVFINIKNFFEESMKVLRPALPSSIEIVLKIPDDLPEIKINPGQFYQLLMNLSLNASDAMENRGILTFEAQKETITGNITCASCHNFFSGEFIRLKIQDTGHGIKNELLDKIFEPFFTSRNFGEGTGMGLSVVHGITHECGGHITIHSGISDGTEFSVYFPVIANESDHHPEIEVFNNGKGQEFKLTGNIVVIDDEEVITKLLKRILNNIGLSVTAFSDSLEAKKYILKNQSKIDLIITDQTMPKLTGIELGKIIKGEKLDIPVILISGMLSGFSEKEIQDLGFYAFISKPFNLKTLMETIETALKRNA